MRKLALDSMGNRSASIRAMGLNLRCFYDVFAGDESGVKNIVAKGLLPGEVMLGRSGANPWGGRWGTLGLDSLV